MYILGHICVFYWQIPYTYVKLKKVDYISQLIYETVILKKVKRFIRIQINWMYHLTTILSEKKKNAPRTWSLQILGWSTAPWIYVWNTWESHLNQQIPHYNHWRPFIGYMSYNISVIKVCAKILLNINLARTLLPFPLINPLQKNVNIQMKKNSFPPGIIKEHCSLTTIKHSDLG